MSGNKLVTRKLRVVSTLYALIVPVQPSEVKASRPLHPGALVALIAATIAIAGCGASKPSSSSTASARAPSSASSSTAAGALPPAVSELPTAERPRADRFPSARGHTLQQLASLAGSSAQFGAATGSFTPGARRLAFGLNTSSGAFVYAPTAVYLAKSPNSPASGPFLAPADPMTVTPAYRSQQNSGPGGVKAIYETEFRVPAPGTYYILALTRTSRGLIGSAGEIAVAASSPIPDVGARSPAIATDTLASTHGDIKLLTTRLPPENMHSVSLDAVLGKRPVALLFSTPQLCTSRVCGPVTDIVAELEHEYENRITFIHEEVYVNNQPSQGLRPQLKAFHLETEPWLFTINQQGMITARLEGAFGVHAATQALEAALR